MPWRASARNSVPSAILVNNAGFSVDASILDMTEALWDEAIDTNLKGVFLVTRSIVPDMIERRYGRIINISSRSHLGGEPNKSNYSAAKGGVVASRARWPVNGGPYDITVNSVAAGLYADRAVAGAATFCRHRGAFEKVATDPTRRNAGGHCSGRALHSLCWRRVSSGQLS